MSAAMGGHPRERRRVSAGLGAALALIGSAILPGVANATTYYDVIVGNQIYTIGVADPQISYEDNAATITATDWWSGSASDPSTAIALREAMLNQYEDVFKFSYSAYAFNADLDRVTSVYNIVYDSPDDGTQAGLSRVTSYSYVVQSGAVSYVPEIDGAALAQGVLAIAGIGLWCAGWRRQRTTELGLSSGGAWSRGPRPQRPDILRAHTPGVNRGVDVNPTRPPAASSGSQPSGFDQMSRLALE
ncbi:hypothetical protein V6X63_10170 [Spiribacter sp. 221]|uniref:hypothetical protein n=1 Tax=Spiribacter onubensis TaxID=3122420 RepID=UPI00349F50B8